MPKRRTIRVFMASPGDLTVERRAFKDVIEELNDGFGDGAEVKFEALGWEDTLASTGRRSQGVINREIDRCDVFILAMHRRWGQEAPDAQPYSSYTEVSSATVKLLSIATASHARTGILHRSEVLRRGSCITHVSSGDSIATVRERPLHRRCIN